MQKNNHRRSDNRRYTKTVGIQMTTDMPEIIKVKENMQKRKETIIMENINSNYETGKKESAIIALSFLEIYRFLNTKENKNPSKKNI
jgi:hypothetical protein